MEAGNLNINLSYESEWDDVNYWIYGINTRLIDDNGYGEESSPQFNFNGGTVTITSEEDSNNIYVAIDAQGGNMNIANTKINIDLNGVWNFGVGVGNYWEDSKTFYGGKLNFTNSTLDVRMSAGYAAYFGELIGAEDIYYYTGAEKLTNVNFDDVFGHDYISERYDYVSESELRLVMSSSKLEEGNDNNTGGDDTRDPDNNTGGDDTRDPDKQPNQTSKPTTTNTAATKTTTSPKTGDNSNAMLYIVLLAISSTLIIKRKKLFSYLG